MAEPHVVSALRDKRAEVSGIIADLERRISQYRADLVHLDATLRMFAPDLEPETIAPKKAVKRNDWFRPGEGARLIYDALRTAPDWLTTREVSERVMAAKGLDPTDGKTRELIQKTVAASLKRLPDVVATSLGAGKGMAWRVAA